MSVQLYPISDKDYFDSSWWTWRPVWNLAVDRSKGRLNSKDGNHNDPVYIDCEVMLEALDGVTSAEVLQWCQVNNYYEFDAAIYDEFLIELRQWLEANKRGAVIG